MKASRKQNGVKLSTSKPNRTDLTVAASRYR